MSIHEFTGNMYLQADFANSYLGGGVWSGGGTQEESMFLEYTELLVTTLLVEKMLPYESVEIEGAKRYIDHNMMASMMASPHLEMSQQFCRPADAVFEVTCITVALDAVNYKYDNNKQYQSFYINREIRKCLAALSLPLRCGLLSERYFVTGLWGCGAFRGDVELKFIIQWIVCSLEPSVTAMIFCPWDKRQYLLDCGLDDLKEKLQGKVSVKKVLDLLVQGPDYQTSRSTFRYLLHKLSSDM